MNAGLRKDVVRKRLSRNGVAHSGGEDSLAFLRRRDAACHDRCVRIRVSLFQPLVSKKEKSLILAPIHARQHDRTADGGSILVLRVLPAPRGKEGPRHQFVVAKKLEEVAVEAVGARSRDNVDDGSRVAAILGAVEVGNDLEFLNEIHAGRAHSRRRIVQRIVVGDTVQQVIIAALPRAVHIRILGAEPDLLGVEKGRL